MHFSALIAALLLLLQSAAAPDPSPVQTADDVIYLLTVTSQAVGGTTERICVHVRLSFAFQQLFRPFLLTVDLEFQQTSSSLLRERLSNEFYYRCIPCQLPDVRVESEASIRLQITGGSTSVNKVTKILVKPRTQLVFIETDKPIYKPGQTVNFRIVSLNTNFLTYNQMFPTIEVQNPMSNRIGQWLNISTTNGLVDLSYPTSTEAPHGLYIITVWNQNNEPVTENFEISEYVLPKFEVTVQCPSVVTIQDTTVTVKVCAKYTYGKPVEGSVKTVVCRSSFRFWWFRGRNGAEDICKTYTGTTDSSGCVSHVLDLNDFAITSTSYEDQIRIDSEVEESGTGVILKGSASITITAEIIRITFEDSPSVFKLGMNYVGKVKVIGPDSSPLINKAVTLTIRNINSVRNLVTNADGIAEFSLVTDQWRGQTSVSLEAQCQVPGQSTSGQGDIPSPAIAYLTVEAFFSNSNSFITLQLSQVPLICGRSAIVRAQYLIQGSALSPQQQTQIFFYMVFTRGTLAQQGSITVTVRPTRENRGQLTFQLQNVQSLAPVAQVVIYALLYTGEAIADSMNFPIQLCLPNRVSLNFMSQTELPGVNTTLLLVAQAGSLCSVRALDQSLLLLKPEKERDAQSIFDLLPVQTISGYPWSVKDEDPDCVDGSPMPMPRPMPMPIDIMSRRRFPVPSYGDNDVYSIFRKIGIKILTNAVVRKPVECFRPDPFMAMEGDILFAMAAPVAMMREASPVAQSGPPITTVRKFFPETWIWDLVPVGWSGRRSIIKTVPDTITTWEADAFCTSPVGFGVAPRTKLTAFQPFFVSLSMPSSVIRGEVFTLKATVFNYLQSCIMVKVTLAVSQQFTVLPCRGCVYTRCLCVDESFTFTWTITPQALGQITISVTAEAIQAPCGNKPVTVPQKGRVDTVINTLLVLAEGTVETKTFNELMCPSGVAIERFVVLSLPNVYVSGSAVVFVSVVGDLMGRCLKNVANLLAMPGGCGEQTMLKFAPNIFILQYLESTNQLTVEIRSRAVTFLISGYQLELTYKHTDGSYSAFGMSDPSGNTWLTAFVMKSFWAAKRYIFIAQTEVDQARAWLGQRQQANGCFASVGQLFHSDMKGGVNDEVTLSAYIIAALLEIGVSTTDPVVVNGLTCLRNAASQVTSTYAIALMSYTFTLAGDQAMRTSLLSILNARAIVSGAGRHWSSQNTGTVDSLEVEMTSYVLLALLSGPFLPGFDMSYCASIVQWVAQQQNAYGGYASTQDTVVALQALAKYSTATYTATGSVTVTVTSPSGVRRDFTVNQSNRLLFQESQLQEVTGRYRVYAQGTGCVYVQFTLRYNIPPPADYSSFSIAVVANGNCWLLIQTIEVIVTVRYNGRRDWTNMVLIEVKLLSGFSLDRASVKHLDTHLEDDIGTVKRVDVVDGVAFIYISKLKKGEECRFSLLMVQEMVLENLMPAVVKIYDYYQTDDVAVTQFSSPCSSSHSSTSIPMIIRE